MESFDMDRAAPILIRIYKEESTLEVWKQDRTGTFARLKAYPTARSLSLPNDGGKPDPPRGRS
jgi:murein L,D-transpeptidase YafK